MIEGLGKGRDVDRARRDSISGVVSGGLNG